MSGKGFFSLILCAGLAVAALHSGCRQSDSNPLAPGPPDRVHLSCTHADTAEAGEFAVWLSGKLRAPDSLISELLYNLKYLRYVFGDSVRYHDSIRVLNARRFLPPWEVSKLEVKFDSATAQKVNQGQYHGWDSLDVYLRPDTLTHADQMGWASIRFKPNLHPRRLAELYRTLPGIIDAEPNSYIFTEWTTFPIFPRFDGKNLSYAFTLGFDAYPVWYFIYTDGVPGYLGLKYPSDPNPSWWSEAMLNMQNFAGWDGM